MLMKTAALPPNRSCRFILTALILLLLPLGCGYKNPYQQIGGDKPVSIYISTWPNQTSELGLESVIHQNLQQWLKKSNRIRIAASAESADYILSGVIASISLSGISYNAYDRANEVEARLLLTCDLKERQSGQKLWQESGLELRESFPVTGQSVQRLGERKKALAKISDDLGEYVYLKTIDALSKI